MGRDMGPILDRIAKLEEANRNLAEFARKVIQVAFDGGYLDGGDIQAMGVQHELLYEDMYSPKVHGEELAANFQPGDIIYVYTDLLRDSASESTE